MVRELIDKIVVYEPKGKKPNRTQQIDIYFNFIGKYELEYTNEELQEIQRKNEQKKRKKKNAKNKRKKIIKKHIDKRKKKKN